MSVWTQATIKFWAKGELNIGEIQRLVGYASDFYDCPILKPWDNREHFLPSGSEGTLNIYVLKTTKKQTVFIVAGGLRDVYSTRRIKEWFDKVTHRSIRGFKYITKAKGVAICDCDGDGEELKLKYVVNINEPKEELK